MIKVFCDACGAEITPKNMFGSRDSQYEVTVKVNTAELPKETVSVRIEKSVPGDICKYCILDAIHRLDDRPRIEAMEPEKG